VWFQRLTVDNLRNLTSVRLDLQPGLNYFYGANGAGKTALLESVHFLARGRSFRAGNASDLIQKGSEVLRITASVEDEHRGLQTIGIARSRRDRAEIRINGEAGRMQSEAALLLPLQIMVPSLSDLVFGPPAERRRWLDWGTFHVKPDYLRTQRSFVQALRQRNGALRAVAAGRLGPESLQVWNDELVKHAERVSSDRAAYLRDLLPFLLDAAEALVPGLELSVSYRQGWPEGQDLGEVLSGTLAKEVKSGATQCGPHRAEVELRAHGMAAAAALSRGQGKSLASAMTLSQSRLLMQTARRASVFLIDDVGAELDLQRTRLLFRLLMDLGVQVLATSTHTPADFAAFAEGRMATFHVEQGSIEPQ
jgi:DNA replication and repair protein RecF